MNMFFDAVFWRVNLYSDGTCLAAPDAPVAGPLPLMSGFLPAIAAEVPAAGSSRRTAILGSPFESFLEAGGRGGMSTASRASGVQLTRRRLARDREWRPPPLPRTTSPSRTWAPVQGGFAGAGQRIARLRHVGEYRPRLLLPRDSAPARSGTLPGYSTILLSPLPPSQPLPRCRRESATLPPTPPPR